MIIRHGNATPRIDSDAWIAPNAVVCGDVSLSPGCRVMHGAQLIAEDGAIEIGRDCIVMQNAVSRSTARHSLRMGDHCLVGAHAHVVGCRVEDEVFIATGASIFHAAVLEHGSEVRVNAVVHLKSRLKAGSTVPIGWIAVGDPAEILPPQDHERIWSIQEPLDFPGAVYGFERTEASMAKITRRLSEALGTHFDDEEQG